MRIFWGEIRWGFCVGRRRRFKGKALANASREVEGDVSRRFSLRWGERRGGFCDDVLVCAEALLLNPPVQKWNSLIPNIS